MQDPSDNVNIPSAVSQWRDEPTFNMRRRSVIPVVRTVDPIELPVHHSMPVADAVSSHMVSFIIVAAIAAAILLAGLM